MPTDDFEVHVVDPDHVQGRPNGQPQADMDVHVVDPMSVGQLPKDIFAILQQGRFDGGTKKTVIELTHNKHRVDRAVQYVRAYGDEGFTYRVYYGRIVWETEGDIVPEAAPVQQLFDPGVRVVKGVKMVGDLPIKGRPGKVKKSKRKTVEVE